LEFRISVRTTFPLIYLGERIDVAYILGIKLRGLVKVCNRGIKPALLAIQYAQQIVDMPILGREISCMFDALPSEIEIPLTQCQHPPIGPAGRLCGGNPGDDGEALVSASVVADLQGSRPHVEGLNNLAVLSRCWIWEYRPPVTSKDHGNERQRQHSISKWPRLRTQAESLGTVTILKYPGYLPHWIG